MMYTPTTTKKKQTTSTRLMHLANKLESMTWFRDITIALILLSTKHAEVSWVSFQWRLVFLSTGVLRPRIFLLRAVAKFVGLHVFVNRVFLCQMLEANQHNAGIFRERISARSEQLFVGDLLCNLHNQLHIHWKKSVPFPPHSGGITVPCCLSTAIKRFPPGRRIVTQPKIKLSLWE